MNRTQKIFAAILLVLSLPAFGARIDEISITTNPYSLLLDISFCRLKNDVWPIVSFIGYPCHNNQNGLIECRVRVMVHNETLNCNDENAIHDRRIGYYRLDKNIAHPVVINFETSEHITQTMVP